MGIIAETVGILSSGALGGLTGFIGSFANRIIGFKERDQTHRHALDMAKIETERDNRNNSHELQLHELNLKAAREETEREVMVAHQAGSWAAMTASQEGEAALSRGTKESGWVTDSKAMTRPILTFFLWLAVLIVFWFVDGEGRLVIMSAVVYCATAATLWWFADRAPAYKELVGNITMKAK